MGKTIEEVIKLVAEGRDEHGFLHDKWSRARQVADWLRQETDRIAETLEGLAGQDDLPAGSVDGVFWALQEVTSRPRYLHRSIVLQKLW